MAYRFDVVHRLEPCHHPADLARGLAAEVADPLWFLAGSGSSASTAARTPRRR